MKANLPHILVIDDDDRLRSLIRQYLTENGFLVVTAENAIKAAEALEFLVFDLIILDEMMPLKKGTEFLLELRQTNATPVIMLTAMGETSHKISGLEAGADDYLAKPFEPKELLLRINSILRRTQKNKSNIALSAALTSAEEKLLNMLSSSGSQPLSRAEIAAKNNIDERAVDVQIARLRKKLANPQQIQTVRGEGYKLIN